MLNNSLALQLAGLNLSPKNLTPRQDAQKPRCQCHNKYLDKCPSLQPAAPQPVAKKARVK